MVKCLAKQENSLSLESSEILSTDELKYDKNIGLASSENYDGLVTANLHDFFFGSTVAPAGFVFCLNCGIVRTQAETEKTEKRK